jgi:hypothetical protein
VLSGAHENMSEIENTLVGRVSDFVAAMNEVAHKAGTTNSDVERNIAAFQATSLQALNDLSQVVNQFDAHGRSLAEAVALIDTSNRRTEGALAERTGSLQELILTLDSKGGDLEQRLSRFADVLDQSLEGAAERAREVARLTTEAATSGAEAITENFEAIRAGAEDERQRLGEAMRSIYDQATEEAHAMLSQSAQRFTDVLDGLKEMTAEMQRELEATRTELRKGILELPQETAESAAQMRRVVLDQIEALAELNRIVARHGRGLDAVEPAARRMEAVEPAVAARRMEPAEAPRRPPPAREEPAPTNGGARPEPARARADITGVATPPMPARRADAPALSPAQPAAAASGRTGWLSDLLTRASQEAEAAVAREATPPREAPPQQEGVRAERSSIDSLDTLAVDIARMIDHDAAAEMWDRYKRGERNVATRKLYTMQGQKAFEEVRRKYRSDREFTRTVDRYIGEFERLLEEVSRDDRGQALARSYLTSETGKVYTMLAHAAGRFD